MSEILDNFDENFPDWTNPEIGIDGMVENILAAEEKHKNAKVNLFEELVRISKEALAEGPEFLQHAPFCPGDDLFTFRGMPLDGILTSGYFDTFEAIANGGDDVFTTRVFIDLHEEDENVGMFGVLVWRNENGAELAWINGDWVGEWDMSEDGPRACEDCPNKDECPEYLGNRIKEEELRRIAIAKDKMDEKFPKLGKFLRKNHLQIALGPSSDSPALRRYDEMMAETEYDEFY